MVDWDSESRLMTNVERLRSMSFYEGLDLYVTPECFGHALKELRPSLADPEAFDECRGGFCCRLESKVGFSQALNKEKVS